MGDMEDVSYIRRATHSEIEEIVKCSIDYTSMFKPKQLGPLEIKEVIFNNPATIVIWTDGTKTVVKVQEDDVYDPEKGLAMAICKKMLGNKGNYCNVFKRWIKEKEN